MNRKLITASVGMAMLAITLGGCGGGAGQASDSQVTAAVNASAKEMSPEDAQEQAVQRFMSLLNQLRALPQLAPLFDLYQVKEPVVIEDDVESAGLIALLEAVKITLVSGTVTITNRETGGVIFSAPRPDLASGIFHAENLPSGTPPVTACTSFTYSAWSACQPDGTQTRAVATSSPAGCTGGTSGPLSQACTYAPPTACTSFTYSAWGTCQPDGTQTRTVATSSPAGCTGGSPGPLTQTCTYTPPATACTSFMYSAWGSCQADGTQTRTVATSSPAGCTGGSPGPLTQACT
ncbi:MAG TPA: hypothetical protein VFQ39_14465, partial [Longimicrobium sp.]|nr:hypothetical protein [Longimicrobium sp.]